MELTSVVTSVLSAQVILVLPYQADPLGVVVAETASAFNRAVAAFATDENGRGAVVRATTA